MTQTFLLTNAADAPAAVATGLPCGFLCYRITRAGVLQRTPLPRSTRGGLLGLTEAPALSPSRLPELQQALAAECHRRGYRGILADLPPASAQSLLPALSALCRQGYAVFLPPEAARDLPESRVLLPGSLSGGTLESMLESYAEAWGKHRLCLDLQRCHHRFSMPSFAPQGQPLSRPELQQLLDTHHPKVFFSTALCTQYFTLHDAETGWHLVLFDDAASAGKRLQRTVQWGVPTCFLLYSEWGSDVCALVRQKK